MKLQTKSNHKKGVSNKYNKKRPHSGQGQSYIFILYSIVSKLYYMSIKKTNDKKRNWVFLLYPDSAPVDWMDKLTQTGLQCAVSPLHDKDLNPDGTKKKPHYHIILTYSGPTSYGVVKKLTEDFNAPIPQALEQVKGYYRYLTHLDNPEKYQYDAKEIRTVNGFDIQDYVQLTSSEKDKIKKELIDVIRENNIMEYSDLVNYTLDSLDGGNYFSVVSSNTIFFNQYITSYRYNNKDKDISKKSDDTVIVDISTGEIFPNDNN